ncbi:MAG: hypothetical protein HOW73_46195, partial [Polyangiaceae bacterium]|nr:hypothetical protein [Polyangiaceae bacterium]
MFVHAGGLAVLPSASAAVHVWSDSFWTASALAAAIALFRLARAVSSRRERAAWFLLGLGASSWFVTMLWWTHRELVDGVRAPVLELPSIGFAVM